MAAALLYAIALGVASAVNLVRHRGDRAAEIALVFIGFTVAFVTFSSIFFEMWEQARLRVVRRARWEAAMRRLELASVIPDDGDGSKLLPMVGTLGAGHKMACLGFTHLIARLRRRTLVLFDEPELHTHPRLLSLMMRELALLLEEHESFAVVSTHSPIVLQEVPARQIRVLRRDGEILHVSKYPGESFGEDLNEIVRLGFGLAHDERSYLKILRREVEIHGLSTVREKYADAIGLPAHLALASLEEVDP
jgi:hypothetical protein